MAKFSGKVGYVKSVETAPGVWEEQYIEKQYHGDVVKNISKNQPSGNVNDNIVIANSISIIADPFANENFQHMKYITFMKNKWRISSVEIVYPRIILSLGGLYNE